MSMDASLASGQSVAADVERRGPIGTAIAYVGYFLGVREHPRAEAWRQAGDRVIEAMIAAVRSDQDSSAVPTGSSAEKAEK